MGIVLLVAALSGLAPAYAQRVGPPPSREAAQYSFASVVKKAAPAVVNVYVRGRAQVTSPWEEEFRRFFGEGFGLPQERLLSSLGSGVIVGRDGVIVTNAHVVKLGTAAEIRIALTDRREFDAKLLLADEKMDIAVLRIEGGDGRFPYQEFADSDAAEVGDMVLAIGNPFGVGQTVTSGIVSALGRTQIAKSDAQVFIQTDAAINPGNSGGALVNERGELIGINTAIIAHGSEGNQGIGFAVPINLARNVMDQILKNGKVTRARLGILPQDVTPTIARQFGVKDSQGALVGEVEANSPAQKAGLKTGDIILEVNTTSVYDANQLRNIISSMRPDSNVNLKVWRDGAQRTLPVTLGELNPEEARVRGGGGRGNNTNADSALDGVSVEDLTSQVARGLGLSAGISGVVVTEVSPGSAAASAGLQRGDVIQEVNRKPVKNAAEFEAAVRNSKDGTLLLVNRDGHTTFVAI